MKPKVLTLEETQELLWRYDKGCSISQLQVIFKKTRHYIKGILKDHGILKEKNKDKRMVDELYRKDEIDGKVCVGMSYRDYLRKAGYRS